MIGGGSFRVRVHSDREAASRALADRVEEELRHPSGRRGPVFALPTGHTPIPLYRELRRRHREQGLSFREAWCFNLDEYWPIAAQDPHSFHAFMREHFWSAVDLRGERCVIPNGDLPAGALAEHCAWIEERIRAAGGIGLAVLGLGRNGHLGFNEPGSAPDSRTRRVELDAVTRIEAAREFGEGATPPRHGLTLGLGTILEARRVVLAAFGAEKASIVRRLLRSRPDPALPASFLATHPAAEILLDSAATGEGGEGA